MDNIKIVSFEEQQKSWLRECLYSSLFLISCTGKIPLSRLIEHVTSFTALDLNSGRKLTASIVQSLQRDGQIYEIKPNVYSALPPYAIQKNLEEWHVFGDARVDISLMEKVPVFQINHPDEYTDGMILERLLLIESISEEQLFESMGIKPFRKNNLIDLFQDAEAIIEPEVWPGYEPSPCDYWEELNQGKNWQRVKSYFEIEDGLCRGINVDRKGNIVFEKYYFRHKEGWSPLTLDEARLWIFRIRSEVGNPYQSLYYYDDKSLILPFELPSSAYLALRYLGDATRVRGNKLVIENIDNNVAQIICKRMCLELREEKKKWRD